MSAFVADLAPLQSRSITLRREATGSGGDATVLILADDVARLLRLPDTRDLTAVLYQHQIHLRRIDTKEGNSVERIFIDGNGLIRAMARLVLADYGVNDGEAREVREAREATGQVGDEIEEEDEEKEKERGEERGGLESANTAVKRRVKRRPFVWLNSSKTRIKRLYMTAQSMVDGGTFSNIQQAKLAMKWRKNVSNSESAFANNGGKGGRLLPWNACPEQLKRDYFERGGTMPASSNAKPVEQIDPSTASAPYERQRVARRFDSQSEALRAMGVRVTNGAIMSLRRAISNESVWKGWCWRHGR